MGIGLVKSAYETADRLRLDHAPTRLLVFMAVSALDTDSQPVYFGGRDALAVALGVPRDANGHKSVTRAMRALTTAGIVVVGVKGAPGRNTRYQLALSASSRVGTRDAERPVNNFAAGDAERPVSNPEQGTFSGETPDAERPEQGTLIGQTGDVQRPERGTLSVPLRRKEEDKEEIQEEGEDAPARLCTRHTSWDHEHPCRLCGVDRRTAEAQVERRAAIAPALSPLLAQVTPAERSMLDDAARGFGTVPDYLQPALAELIRERNGVKLTRHEKNMAVLTRYAAEQAARTAFGSELVVETEDLPPGLYSGVVSLDLHA